MSNILTDGIHKHEKVVIYQNSPVGKIVAVNFEEELITVEIIVPASFVRKIPTADEVCGILKENNPDG